LGILIGWFARRARHVGERLDEKVDEVLDHGLEKVHDLVSAKLHGEPALTTLEGEVVENGEPTDRTKTRVQLALEEAVETDQVFADALGAAVAQVQAAERQTGVANATDHGIANTGDLNATNGGVVIGGVTGGTVSLHRADPS
jgi:hypothetical protein